MVSSGLSCRATELITPILTEFASPRGLPMASTTCPCRKSSERPNRRNGKSVCSILMTARSLSRSIPMTFASRIVPAGLAAPLARKQTGVAAVALIAERVTRRKDLYHRITRATGQRFERHAQITQRIGWLAFNRPLFGLCIEGEEPRGKGQQDYGKHG